MTLPGCGVSRIHLKPSWKWLPFSQNTMTDSVWEQIQHNQAGCCEHGSTLDAFMPCKCDALRRWNPPDFCSHGVGVHIGHTYHSSSCISWWWSRTQCRGPRTWGSKSETTEESWWRICLWISQHSQSPFSVTACPILQTIVLLCYAVYFFIPTI